MSNFINTEAFILSKILANIVEKDRPLNLFDQDRDTPTKVSLDTVSNITVGKTSETSNALLYM